MQKSNDLKPWIEQYIISCCNYLGEDTEDLTVKISPKPGKQPHWLGALLAFEDGSARMELSTKIRNTPYWRKVILHECLHYKMRRVDFLVKCGIPSLFDDRIIKRKVKKSYSLVLEDYIWAMTNSLFPMVENFNNGTEKTKNKSCRCNK